MGVKQTVITTITCDRCGNEITDEERQKITDALEVPTGYKTDALNILFGKRRTKDMNLVDAWA